MTAKERLGLAEQKALLMDWDESVESAVPHQLEYV
jgi:hypothetical protein